MKDSLVLAALPQIQEISKSKIKPLVKSLAAETENPTQAYATLKRLHEFCAQALKVLTPAVLEEMEDGETEISGMSLKAQARGRFTFDHSASWQDLKNQLAVLEQQQKELIDPIKAQIKNLEKLMQKKILKKLQYLEKLYLSIQEWIN